MSVEFCCVLKYCEGEPRVRKCIVYTSIDRENTEFANVLCTPLY